MNWDFKNAEELLKLAQLEGEAIYMGEKQPAARCPASSQK